MINDIINEQWQGHSHGEVEAALKLILQQILSDLENGVEDGSIGREQLTQALKDAIDSIATKVSNSRRVNGYQLNADVTIGTGDIKVGNTNKTLSALLDEMQEDIEHAGGSGVTQQDIQDAIDTLVAGAPQQLDTLRELAAALNDNASFAAYITQQLGNKQDALVAGNGIVIGSDGKTVSVAESIRTGAGKGATAVQSVSVESEQDGTVDIHVDDDKYTINLNHEHQGMAKLAKFVASNPPASMANDTIYAQVDNLNSPTEIQSLWLFGCEFAGGIPDTGLPQVYKPISGSVIDLGSPINGGASKVVTIKARNLTNNLTVTVGTGLTVTYNGTTASSVTIPKADAILGADVTVAYTGTAELDDGAMTISHGNDMLASYTVTAIRVWEVLDLTQSAGRVDVEEAWLGQSSFGVQNDKRTAIVDLSGCEKLRMTASETTKFYYVPLASVPDFGTVTSDYREVAYANYVPSGVTGRIEVAAGATVDIDIPSSWNYIAIGLQSTSSGPMHWLPSYCAVK